jgi:hypothetical protein
MADPFTLMAIGMGVGALGKAVGGYMDAASLYTESDKERLEELERMQDLNQLGLTDEEAANMNRAMMDPMQAVGAQRATERRQMAAAGDIGAGSVAKQMLLEEEAEMKGRGEVGKAISSADLEMKKMQEQEIQQLKKQRDLRKTQTTKAILTGTADIAGQGLTMYGQKGALEEMTGQATLGAQQQQAYQQQMIQQQYMNQLYGPGYAPYQQYYNRWYGGPTITVPPTGNQIPMYTPPK